jgi:hypothetical protein
MGNGASVDNRDIRPFFKRDEAIPSLFQGRHKGFRFKLVDFTTECGNSNGCHFPTGLLKNSIENQFSSQRFLFDLAVSPAKSKNVSLRAPCDLAVKSF